jgi:hypothetical protein
MYSEKALNKLLKIKRVDSARRNSSYSNIPSEGIDWPI